MSRPGGSPGSEPGTTSGNAAPRGRAVFWIAAALAVATAGVFAPVVGYPFVNYDDDVYVYENPEVVDGLTAEGVAWALTHRHKATWHPLTSLSHMLDVEVFGLDAGGHHLTSLVLHAATAVILFLVLRSATGFTGRSAVAAALFALHPLRVESVAWISERKDVLSGFFLVLALAAHLRYAARPGALRYAVVVVAAAAGLMAKPMLVTLPFVLLLLDGWPLGRLRDRASARLALVEKLPLLALSASVAVVTLVAQRGEGAVGSLEAFPFGVRLANAVVAYAAYVFGTLWPAGLAVVYPHPGGSLPAWQVGGAAALVAGITVAAIAAARRAPYLCVGWLWFLGMLVPVIGLVQVGQQAMADRYTYLPSIGLAIVVAWGGADLLSRRPRGRAWMAAASAAALASLALATTLQLRHWRDSVALWERALAVTRGNAVAHLNLALALGPEGRLDEQVAHLERAVEIRPRAVKAHYNLGTVLASRGDLERAAHHLSEAVRLDPAHVGALNNLGGVRSRQGRLDDAAAHYAAALALEPDHLASLVNLAGVRARQGRLADAVGLYSRAVDVDPARASTHRALGAVRLMQGDPEGAVRSLREAVRLDPGDVEARERLAEALRRAGSGR